MDQGRPEQVDGTGSMKAPDGMYPKAPSWPGIVRTTDSLSDGPTLKTVPEESQPWLRGTTHTAWPSQQGQAPGSYVTLVRLKLPEGQTGLWAPRSGQLGSMRE